MTQTIFSLFADQFGVNLINFEAIITELSSFLFKYQIIPVKIKADLVCKVNAT